ncbi:hypothetical protein EVA_16115 [gut metagenome]|uniref:Uncharacterized protein n=1 Tax=gut metagenome TaxID=749906 RepID=J9G1T9_9ZZZZ
MCSPTVLLRIEFTATACYHTASELLPHFSTLTEKIPAVYLCCTCPRVTPGGRYPLFLPYGARTFLIRRFSPCARDCSACSFHYCTKFSSLSQY